MGHNAKGKSSGGPDVAPDRQVDTEERYDFADVSNRSGGRVVRCCSGKLTCHQADSSVHADPEV